MPTWHCHMMISFPLTHIKGNLCQSNKALAGYHPHVLRQQYKTNKVVGRPTSLLHPHCPHRRLQNNCMLLLQLNHSDQSNTACVLFSSCFCSCWQRLSHWARF